MNLFLISVAFVLNSVQFLPQDRVCEFAKLTPIQLLEETEKAVGDPNLPIQHRQLIDRSKELKILQVVKLNHSLFTLSLCLLGPVKAIPISLHILFRCQPYGIDSR